MTFDRLLSASLIPVATLLLTGMGGTFHVQRHVVDPGLLESTGADGREVRRRVERVPATPLGTVHASWYGGEFAGRTTASGEVFDPSELTAAHPSLPFGTKLRVTNPEDGRSVVVRVNDRGPFVAGRAIDLSEGAAARLGLLDGGVARVSLELLRP